MNVIKRASALGLYGLCSFVLLSILILPGCGEPEATGPIPDVPPSPRSQNGFQMPKGGPATSTPIPEAPK